MRHSPMRRWVRLTLLAGSSAAVLTACGTEQPLDFDLRGNLGTFSTAEAATAPLADRPRPDSRGVISYPTYQVAVAQRGDSLADVASRVGVSVGELARYNGIEPDVPLRQDEIIALPGSVASAPMTAPATGRTDISALAGNAINRAPASPGVQTSTLAPSTPAPAPVQTGVEPARHRVERGETAYTVARLYNVPVKALAEWNGLGADFAVREGQFLLIPVAQQNPPQRSAPATASAAPTPAAAPVTSTLPGQGSPTPTPPSAKTPLPDDDTAKPMPETITPRKEPVADVGKTTQTTSSSARMATPVQGSIIRGYSKGKNEGINIKGADGAAVKAAAAGTVAAITKSGDGIPIVVVRHPDNLLTVYANVASVGVAKGDSVSRGQQIATLRSGSDAYVHFEVRNGFDSVDPAPYLN